MLILPENYRDVFLLLDDSNVQKCALKNALEWWKTAQNGCIYTDANNLSKKPTTHLKHQSVYNQHFICRLISFVKST